MEEGRWREGYVAGQFLFCGTFVVRRIIHMTDCFNVNVLYTALGDGGIGFYQSKLELRLRCSRPSAFNSFNFFKRTKVLAAQGCHAPRSD